MDELLRADPSDPQDFEMEVTNTEAAELLAEEDVQVVAQDHQISVSSNTMLLDLLTS